MAGSRRRSLLLSNATPAAGFLLLWLTPSALDSQPREALTERHIRTLTRQSDSEAKGDSTMLVLALDRRVREQWGEFESFPLSIVRREDVLVTLTTPYMAYRQALAQYLQIHRPLNEVPWSEAAVIAVSPARIGGPDIRIVEVARDGRNVAPLRSRLRPMTFTNGNGETGVMHAGELHYSMSAFAPGSLVTITARPQEGEPFVYTLSRSELQTLK